MATSNLTRYALLLDDGAVRSVDRLQATYDLKTRADVYDLAVRVLTWATEQQLNGYEFGRHKEGVFQPLHLPYSLVANAWEPKRTNGAHAEAA
jgi:hypothetical protein